MNAAGVTRVMVSTAGITSAAPCSQASSGPAPSDRRRTMCSVTTTASSTISPTAGTAAASVNILNV